MKVDIRQTEATLVASLTLGLFMGLRSSLVSWLRLGLQRKKPAQEFLFFSSSSSSFFFFLLFRAVPVAYGRSQARGPFGAVAAGLCHNHSHTRSEPSL